jgi:hypothetical protein
MIVAVDQPRRPLHPRNPFKPAVRRHTHQLARISQHTACSSAPPRLIDKRMNDHSCLLALGPNPDPAGLLFGASTAVMLKRKLSGFLDMPPSAHADWLLADHKVC